MAQSIVPATYFRSLEQFQQLLAPWQLGEQGFISLLDWHGLSPAEAGLNEDAMQAIGQGALVMGLTCLND